MTNEKDFDQVYEATEALCKTPTDGGENAETTLEDWMRAGDWQNMSAAEMAAEWDALSEE